MTIEYGLYDGTRIYAEVEEGNVKLGKHTFDLLMSRLNDLLIYTEDLEEETENLSEYNRLFTDDRKCDICGKHVTSGYVIHDSDYYCSEECLHRKYPAEEYDRMYAADEAYWTEWEEI